MNTVEPIREEKRIKAMKAVLKNDNIRNWLLFTMGINTGLRISDLRELKIGHVTNDKGKVKENISVYIREKKTKKEKTFKLNKTVQNAIKEYLDSLKAYSPEDYLFRSKKGENKPISREQAYVIINNAARMVGIHDKIGCHTLRKTFGYHARMKGTPIEKLQKIYNHSSPSITMRYIGITQDEIDDVYLDLNL